MISGSVRGGITFSLAVLSLIGNLLVILVVAAKRRLHTMHFFLLANLSLTDCLYEIIYSLDVFSYMSEKYVFGLTWCETSSYLLRALFSTTVYLLCAVTWECHTAIVTPYQFSSVITVKKIIAVVLLWIGNVLFTAVSYFSWTTFFYNDILYICEQEKKREIVIISTILVFVVPFGLITKQQVQISRVAKHQKTQIAQQQHAINSNGQERQQKERLMKSIKESKDALIIIAVFLLSYLPFFVVLILRTIWPKSETLYNAWILAFVLIQAGSTWNPFIYGFRKRQFRRQCFHFLAIKRFSREVVQQMSFSG